MNETTIEADAVPREGCGRRLSLRCLSKIPRANKVLLIFAIALGLTLPEAAFADNPGTNALSSQLANMSIEDLVNVEVVSINSLFKKQTPLEQAPAAAAIVTGDDVRR